MKKITISTQAEFDALQTPEEETLIYLTGEFKKIDRQIDNTILHVNNYTAMINFFDA